MEYRTQDATVSDDWFTTPFQVANKNIIRRLKERKVCCFIYWLGQHRRHEEKQVEILHWSFKLDGTYKVNIEPKYQLELRQSFIKFLRHLQLMLDMRICIS